MAVTKWAGFFRLAQVPPLSLRSDGRPVLPENGIVTDQRASPINIKIQPIGASAADLSLSRSHTGS